MQFREIHYEFLVQPVLHSLDAQGEILTTGWTVQLFLTFAGDLLMAGPDFYENFRRDWQEGRFG